MMACWYATKLTGTCDGWAQPVEVTVALWVYAICATILVVWLASGHFEEVFG